MIGFTNPAFLWCLTGLAIPVVIHLLSRKQSVIIYAGSLRHLDLSFSRQFKSLRLNELLLLLLRMLLITLLVFLISGMWRSARSEKKWLVIENGIILNQSLASLKDSLLKSGYEQRVLAPDFPMTDKADTSSTVADYWELSNRLSALPLSDIVVFSLQRISSLHGQRPPPPENQHWIGVPPMSHDFLLKAQRKDRQDSLIVRTGSTSANATSFKNQTVWQGTSANELYYRSRGSNDSIIIENPKALTVAIIADPGFENDEKILKISLNALQEISGVSIHLTNSSDADYTLFLRSISAKDSLQKNVFDNETDGPLLQQVAARQWRIAKRLSVAGAIDEHLTIELGKILVPGTVQKSVSSRNDARALTALLWSDMKNLKYNDYVARQDLSSLLLVLLLVTLIIERSVAFRRNQ